MLYQPIFISCDVHRNWFPPESPQTFPLPGVPGYDRAIHTVASVRRDAAKAGWKRRGEMDVCPRCVARLAQLEALDK